MNPEYNRLLDRQIRKHLQGEEASPEMRRFLKAVSDSYDNHDQIRAMISRAMEISSGELLEKNKELEEKNEMLESFVYRVSHDLITPANNIISMVKVLSDLLQLEQTSPMADKALKHLDSAARTMQIRIKDLLEMARIEYKMGEKPRYIELEEAAQSVLDELGSDLTSHAIIDMDFSAAPAIVFGRGNISSIFSNLISNGIKYRIPNQPAEIFLRSGQNDRGLWLKIGDKGLGMDLENEKDRLFKLFSRLHDHVEGSGIGLYIIKKIVDTHDGTIDVESRINGGTTFTIQFPQSVIPQISELDPADRGR